MRRMLQLVVVGSLVALQFGAVSPPADAVTSSIGSFEIDGNLADDSPLVNGSNEPVDWATLPATITNITDLSASTKDNIFGNGSKELEPGSWSCVAQKPPGKDDIVSGQIAFRRVNGKQFAYTNFFRKEVNGDAHMDFEFNKSFTPASASCGSVPQRSQGDFLIAFDTENGGATIDVRIFRWDGNATSGVFTQITTGNNAAGAVNIPPARTIPGHANGDFGEAAINLTDTIGDVACGQFSGAWMKTRSATSITAALKDFTTPKAINPDNCPSSTLAKAVRNVSTNGSFGNTATAAPGQTLEYQLTYTNAGPGTAKSVVVSDTIQQRQTFLSCPATPVACGVSGSTVTWNLSDVAPGSRVVTFRVTLASTFPAGTTQVKDVATVRTEQEGTKNSNEVVTTVTAAPVSTLAKGVRDVTSGATAFTATTKAAPGDTLEYQLVYQNTGNAPASNVVISDPIPGKTTYVSCTGGCTATGSPVSSVSWSYATVAPGTTITVTFRVVIDSTGYTQGTTFTISNKASVCDSEEPCKDSPPVTVDVETPNNTLAKAVRNVSKNGTFGQTATASPGDTLEYRLTLKNEGQAVATNVVVSDLIQAHQTYGSCTAGCATDGPPVTKVTWTFASVAPGDTKVLTFTVTLDPTFPAGTTAVKDTATVSSTQEPTENSNETTTTVTAAPISTLDKSVRDVTSDTAFGTATAASPGDTIEYQLVYKNVGDAPASNVVISDPIPAKTSYLSCTGGCTTAGTPVTSVSWSYATVAPGQTITVTFRVLLDTTGFAAGSTIPITNVAQVCTTEESSCTNSPPTTVNVKTPKSSLAKAVRDVTTNNAFSTATAASPGDVIEYQLTYTNSGPGTATNVIVSDPIPARSTYVSCTAACVTDGPPVTTVSWVFASVAPGMSKVMTFQVRLDTAFPSGQTVITNVATSTATEESGTTSSNPTTVTVTAAPKLGLGKAADATGVVQSGDLITYTLSWSNTGNAPATGTTITEVVPAGTAFSSCSNSCTRSGNNVTWALGTVDPGQTGTVTLTVAVTSFVGCTICNVAQIASPAQAGGAPVSSNQVCLVAQPADHPENANASGSALGASVVANPPLVGPINSQLASTSSSQSGVGVDSHETQLPLTPVPNPVLVPADGSLLRADVLRSNSTSTVTPSPAQAHDLGTAEVVGVRVANGLVTADIVRGVASATATGDSSSISSVGSTFKNLRVQGVVLNDVAPNTKISVGDVTGLGLGVTVALREETGSTSGPSATTLSGGTYRADLLVNMIHVHVDDGNILLGGKQPIDIIVSQARAHADFPQTQICNANPTRTVSGHAFIASENTNPSIAPLLVGYTDIPAAGGQHDVTLDGVALPDDGSVVDAAAAESFSSGGFDATTARSYDFASAAEVCITLQNSGCDIYATAVRSVSSSSATALTRGSDAFKGSDATSLVGLVVGGTPINATPPPNTPIVIPGVATVILNEQVCDNGGTLVNHCADGTVAGHTGLTVRAIHVILFDPVAGPGGEIIVSEAHSDATWR